MAKKFRNLAAPILADPEARPEIDAYKRAMADALALAELREARGLTQMTTAARMGTTQPNISAIERREDVYLSTLHNYVAALGGRVEVHAIFPDADFVLFSGDTARGARREADQRRSGRPARSPLRRKPRSMTIRNRRTRRSI